MNSSYFCISLRLRTHQCSIERVNERKRLKKNEKEAESMCTTKWMYYCTDSKKQNTWSDLLLPFAVHFYLNIKFGQLIFFFFLVCGVFFYFWLLRCRKCVILTCNVCAKKAAEAFIIKMLLWNMDGMLMRQGEGLFS